MTALLELDALSVSLSEGTARLPVLREITLELDAGEACGLVGESGSGKSMTAKAIMRLLPTGSATEGDVRFESRSVLSFTRKELLSYRSRDVAMIFQDPRAHINPVRRIGDYLTEALTRAQGIRRAQALGIAKACLRETGIHDVERRLNQYPHELSGGLLQRVMIAAALAIRPKLVIADEPTTALDVTTQSEVMAVLDELRRAHGLALLFITHDLDLAVAVCDRIAVMYAGRVVEERVASLLESDPLHPYSAGLIMSRPSITTTMDRLPAIGGRPLSASEQVSGCAFASRCPHALRRCGLEIPPLTSLRGTRVACWRADELRGTLLERLRGTNG